MLLAMGFVWSSVGQTKIEIPIRKTGTITEDLVTFDVSSDDAEQEDDAIDNLYDDDLDAGWEGAAEDQKLLTLGLRFTEVNLAKGTTIDSAFIYLTSHEAKATDDVANLTIFGEASDNAVTFNETDLITSRSYTSASIEWTVDEEWGLWTSHRTPDIKSIIQEVVNRNGWASGNAIALILEGEDQGVTEVENAREMESFENISDPEDGGDGNNHPERVPKLVIWTNAPSAINGITNKNVAMIHPNPVTNGMMNVNLVESGKADLYIYDLSGKMLKSMNSISQQSNIDVTELSTGLYLLKAVQQNNISTQTFIIK